MPGIGPKTFANIAGFLRITRSGGGGGGGGGGGARGVELVEPLDATRVHPESYSEARW